MKNLPHRKFVDFLHFFKMLQNKITIVLTSKLDEELNNFIFCPYGQINKVGGMKFSIFYLRVTIFFGFEDCWKC